MRRIVLGETRRPSLSNSQAIRGYPTWVLARKPQHELSHSAIDKGTAGASSRLRPPATHEFSVPAQKRLGHHHQYLATAGREQSGERRKQRAICRPQQGSSLLPAEHDQPMPQHQ
jgi:hypothetical protein